MAEIHLAKATSIGGFEKLLALKVIHPKFSQDREFIDMLIDEAKITVQLTHMNICQIFDLGQIDGTFYIAMEFIDGKDLYQLLVKCSELDIAIPFDILTFVAIEACAGLHYAHTRSDNYGRPLNIIHRDISPQNILVSYDGEVKVVDFGIAKASQRSKETESGVIKGKFFYMSPEQAFGRPLDARTDLFSMGICLYEMVTGEMLYNEEKALLLLEKVRKAEIPNMRAKRPDLPPELEQLILKALARDREHRFNDCAEMQRALSSFLYRSWPGFGRNRVREFMEHVFGAGQKFVMPPPPAAVQEQKTQELSMLMGSTDFDPTSGESVIFDLRQLDAVDVEDSIATSAPGVQGLGDVDFYSGDQANVGFDDDPEDAEHTMIAADYNAAVSSFDDDEEDENEHTIAEQVWSASGDLYNDLPPDDDDETAVIDMGAVEAARRVASGDDYTQPQPAPMMSGFQPQANPYAQMQPPQMQPPQMQPPQVRMPQMQPPQMQPPQMQPPQVQAPQVQTPQPPAQPARPQPNRAGESSRATMHGVHDEFGRDALLGRNKPKRGGGGLLIALLLLLLIGGAGAGVYFFAPDLLSGLIGPSAETPATSLRAQVSLTSEPSGALVKLNGQALPEPTPVQIGDLQVDTDYLIEVELKGYEPQSFKLNVAAASVVPGQIIERKTYLKQLKGTLIIISDPPEAEVFLDGRFIGNTPLEKSGFERTRKPLVFRFQKAGYRARHYKASWGSEVELKLDVALDKRGSN
ncbi:protein kinase [Myxococcota bacterium]|nr:protein kinase [Myxococcota bacterium]MBU1430819.1 protein kinase [Myxococcota bacterium]MBU1899655.1 protein kinase [Myxococcota bacterium]